MFRPRVIVGIGEALEADAPGGVRAGGAALEVAIAATRLGHHGVPIARLGQDPAGDALVSALQQMQIDVSHLQHDPDLPTGRLVTRRIGPRQPSVDNQAAFDNLQWDFDLVDVAQSADGVIFGELARRGGQTRNVIAQFLNECSKAIRIYDLTFARVESLERGRIESALQLAHAAVLDLKAAKLLTPGISADDSSEAARHILRQHELDLIVLAEPGKPISLITADESHRSERPLEQTAHASAMVALLHGLLEGRELHRCAQLADEVAQRIAANPDAPIHLKDIS